MPRKEGVPVLGYIYPVLTTDPISYLIASLSMFAGAAAGGYVALLLTSIENEWLKGVSLACFFGLWIVILTFFKYCELRIGNC